jgi:hypothetical protein
MRQSSCESKQGQKLVKFRVLTYKKAEDAVKRGKPNNRHSGFTDRRFHFNNFLTLSSNSLTCERAKGAPCWGTTSDAKRLVVRETDCFERRNGEWKLIHQHASVPSGGEWDGKVTTA